jgi:protein-tyrosine-phosphatase
MQSLSNPVLDAYPSPQSNVFLMMRFKPTEYHGQIGQTIAAVLSDYSLNLIRADSNDYLPQLWDNVEACMDASNYGIAVFEQIDERDINPNVSLELGYFRGQRKKCLILKEKRLPALQTDLSGYLYSEFDAFQIAETVEAQVRRWLRSIGIAKKPSEHLLVFVSAGGTCRCAMAKAITGQLLATHASGYSLRVLSAAVFEPNLPGASEGARRAMREMFGTDLLAGHRSIRLSPALLTEADLILTMDRGLYNVLQKAGPAKSGQSNSEKIHVLKEYFGLKGDVADPWAYQGSPEEAERYRETANELRSIIEPRLNKLVKALHPGSNTRENTEQPTGSDDGLISSSSAQTATLTVVIELTQTGIRHTCEIPLDVRVERLFPALMQKVGLQAPRLTEDCFLTAHLFSRNQNRFLDSTETLRDNGVQEGEVLRIWFDTEAG